MESDPTPILSMLVPYLFLYKILMKHLREIEIGIGMGKERGNYEHGEGE